MNEYEQFAKLFLAEAAKHEQGYVSARIAGRLVKESGLEGIRPGILEKKGFLIGMRLNGAERISWYKASEALTMLTDADAQKVPTGPFEKLEYALQQKAQCEEKLQWHLAEVERIRAYLSALERFEKVRNELDALKLPEFESAKESET